MNLFGYIWEYFSNLPFTIKRILVLMVLGGILGIPMSGVGWTWRLARQSLQLQHCGDDIVKSIFDSIEGSDNAVRERAISHNRAQELKDCAHEAIQHPKNSISFLRDEQKRLFRETK